MAGNRYDSGQGADPRQGWPADGGQASPQRGGGPSGRPEYFTAAQAAHPQPAEPYGADGYGADGYGADGYGADGYGSDQHGDQHGGDPFAADQPGHTRAFAVGDDPYGGYGPYGTPGHQPDGYQDGGYQDGGYGAQDNVAVYRAGGQSAPRVAGPRMPWRPLLTGLYRDPSRTFDRMRDHQVWLPALCVSLLYGVLAVLGMGATHDDVVNSTFAVAVWAIAGAAVGFSIAGAMLGAVTYALARQFGGDGPWQSTIGLAVLIGWTTDVPRLLLALFLPGDNTVVQAVGWATWLLCAFLLTSMVRRVHDLPWGKAAGAAALQLLALLVLIKLPTLG
ncbi:Yip1 family protein [Kitasatospora sp. NPDC088346]|uniref:Yip1 family protein n=1 Tax=Kitasatospora sp. NPDC088346 TaxID=3364073 RepID=UPI0037FB9220